MIPVCACCRMAVQECLIEVDILLDGERIWLCANCKASMDASGGRCWHERLRMPSVGNDIQ